MKILTILRRLAPALLISTVAIFVACFFGAKCAEAAGRTDLLTPIGRIFVVDAVCFLLLLLHEVERIASVPLDSKGGAEHVHTQAPAVSTNRERKLGG